MITSPPLSKPTSVPPKSVESVKQGIAKTAETIKQEIRRSTRIEEPSFATRANSAVLGRSTILKGHIHGSEDLTIDGEVEGSVELQEHRLIIGPNGKMNATVKARVVVVLGILHGNVETRDKLEIRKDAKMVGDVRTARVVIEDGAYFKGTIDIIRAETPKPQPAAKPQSPRLGPSSIAAAGGDIKR